MHHGRPGTFWYKSLWIKEVDAKRARMFIPPLQTWLFMSSTELECLLDREWS